MKYVAIAAIALGIALFLTAVHENSSAGFEDGSFVAVIGLGVLGAAFVIGGALALAVLTFLDI